MSDTPYVVLGAGFAGLVAATELTRLGHDVVVFEASGAVGGLATSHRVDGVSFDTGAHFVTNRLATALGVMDRCDDAVALRRGGLASRPQRGVPARASCATRASRRARSRPDSGRAGPAASAADRFRAEYGRALADEVAIPLVEAWSGLPGGRARAERRRQDPGRHRGDARPRPRPGASRTAPVAIGYCAEAPQSANVWHVYPRDGSRRARRPPRGRSSTVGSGSRPRRGRACSTVTASWESRAGGTDARRGREWCPPSRRRCSPGSSTTRGRARSDSCGSARWSSSSCGCAAATCCPSRSPGSPTAALDFFRVTEAPMAMPWLAPTGRDRPHGRLRRRGRRRDLDRRPRPIWSLGPRPGCSS